MSHLILEPTTSKNIFKNNIFTNNIFNIYTFIYTIFFNKRKKLCLILDERI